MSSRTRTAETTEASFASDDLNARRARGAVLLVGAVALALLIGKAGEGVLAFYWFPLFTGVVYLAAAAAGRSRGTLWAPAIMLTVAGLAAALWLRDGRSPDSFQFLALVLMSLGLGGVIVSLLGQYARFAVSAMSVSLVVLLLGGFFLLEQQGISPFAGSSYAYAALLAVWGIVEIARPAQRSSK